MRKRNDTLNTDTSNCCVHTTGAIVSILSAQPAHATPEKEAAQIEQQNQAIDALTLTLACFFCCSMQPGAAYLSCVGGNALKRLNAGRTHLNYENRPETMAEACQPAYSAPGVVNATACCWSLCTGPAAVSTLVADSTQRVSYLLPMGVNAASMVSNFYPATPTTIEEAITTDIQAPRHRNHFHAE